MPIHKIALDGQNVQLWLTADRSIALRLGQFAGSLDQKKAALQLSLQTYLDTRVLIADLPDGEPAKIKDPARPDFFWEGGYLVARPVRVTIEIVTNPVDGKSYPNVILERLDYGPPAR